MNINIKKYLYSNGKGSNHINVRYFFIEKINHKEVKILCCITYKIIAMCSSKPTQGSLFWYQYDNMKSVREGDFSIYKT